MASSPMLPVADALQRILDSAPQPLACELVALAQAQGRRLAEDLRATRMQPPCPVSAMDGYAVRRADIETVPVTLKLIGSSAAGHGFRGSVGRGETVRIFTGAPVPEGADTIVIQEDAEADGERIVLKCSEPLGRHIRVAGLDFKPGDVLLTKAAGLALPSWRWRRR